MNTDIQNFFQNKIIFVTGGTGFLGKVLIEKILRSTKVRRIYVIVRPKSGHESIVERFNDILKSPLFEKLHKLRPKFPDHIQLMEGDCSQENLGLSNDDYRTLIENVEVIMHCAATVRFNETLSLATQINVHGTADIIKMAKEMKHLKSFVHISTAFVNCTTIHCVEGFTKDKLNVTCEQLLNIKKSLSPEQFDSLTPTLIGKYPNTYSFTKAVSEEFVQTHAESLPICILRPAIVFSTSEEPFAGWMDNIQGAAGVTYGILMGALRVVNTAFERRAPIVPVDYCANIMLAAAWYTASLDTSKFTKNPTIYNFTPEESNLMTWGRYINIFLNSNCQMPYSKIMWYPMVKIISNNFLYRLMLFLYQTIPAYIMDVICKLQGSKMSVVKLNQKISRLTDSLRYFLAYDFTFDTANTRHLWKSMSSEDKKLFNFDMMSLQWNVYLQNNAKGLRRFAAKEEPSTIPAARSSLKRFKICHLAINSIVFMALLWIVKNVFFVFWKW
ncbi:fatty acyl-CoA reductase wat-like [Musca autumnalis]|uniref:fatty acyl-CoA reductase wat-like n=1 Tax=Musca autumnalis TaxID=221902 RepID=UPI003CE7EB9D